MAMVEGLGQIFFLPFFRILHIGIGTVFVCEVEAMLANIGPEGAWLSHFRSHFILSLHSPSCRLFVLPMVMNECRIL